MEQEDAPRSISSWFGLKETSLALFIFAFAYKWIPGVRDLPGDLTVLFMLVTFAFSFFHLFHSKIEIWQFLIVLGVIEIAVISVFSTGRVASSVVDVRSILSFFLLTIPAMLAPVILIRTEGDLRRLVGAILGIIFLVSLYFLWNYLQGISLRNFLLDEGAQVIHPGRILGAQIILFVVLTLIRKVRIYFGLIVIGISFVLLLNTGNRQGILSAILVLIVWFTTLRSDLFRWSTFFASIGIFILFIGLVPTNDVHLDHTAIERYVLIITEGPDADPSSQARLALFVRTIELIKDNPFGIGLNSLSVNGEYDYPHNFFLEAFVSLGWIGGALLSALLLFSLWRTYRLARRHSSQFVYTLFFLLFLHWFFLSTVSGDFNVNRILFAFIGVGISLYDVTSGEVSQPHGKHVNSQAMREHSDKGLTNRIGE